MKKSKPLFIISLLAIFPLPQLAIDLYLPSLPVMLLSMHTSSLLLQLTLTVYIFFLGLSQLIYGPLSDQFGRKPILLMGVLIFSVGSLSAAFSISIYTLLISRAIQGLGMGCGFTIGSAIIVESFSGKELIKMTTYSSMVYSLSPILAPVFGGYIQHYLGWQANFLIMSVLAITLLLAIYVFVPETNRHLKSTALNRKNLINTYAHMIKSIVFLGYIGILTLTFGIMVTFNVVGPFLMQNKFNISALIYGKFLFLVGGSYFLGTVFSSQLLKFFKIFHLMFLGMCLILFSSIAIIWSGWIGYYSARSILILTCVSMFSTGLIFPNAFAKALEIFPEALGFAGSLIGSAGLIGTSLISIISAHIQINQNQSLGWLFLIQIVLAMVCFGMASWKMRLSATDAIKASEK